uniref:Uncharacterized protein n=1 Tax=Anguilla anguilla TaxID=7936 RepID=A0A0E9TFB0_ANGAN
MTSAGLSLYYQLYKVCMWF